MGVAVEPAKGRRARKREQRAVLMSARETVRSDRQYRQRIKKIDLWSVLKMSLCFYMAAFLVAFAAGVALWLIASAFGLVHDAESFMRDLLSSKDYRLIGPQIAIGSVLVGLVLVALMTLITVVGAAFYNLFAELIDGVEVVVVEEELQRKY